MTNLSNSISLLILIILFDIFMIFFQYLLLKYILLESYFSKFSSSKTFVRWVLTSVLGIVVVTFSLLGKYSLPRLVYVYDEFVLFWVFFLSILSETIALIIIVFLISKRISPKRDK